MDSVLFSGLLVHLTDGGFIDRTYIGSHTEDFETALAGARKIAPDLAAVSQKCGASSADVEAFFDLFASTKRAVTLYSQGVNQSWQGTDKVNALINCHLATGRIGIPGAGTVLLDRAAECHGGSRSWRSRQSACGPYGIFGGGDRPCRPFLGRASHGPAGGSQGGGHVGGRRAGRTSRHCGSWAPIRR